MPLSNPNLEIALEVIRKTGHTVGPAAVKDGETRITIDGVLRTYDEIFQMVEDFATRSQTPRKAASA